jgi:hypothetical protein
MKKRKWWLFICVSQRLQTISGLYYKPMTIVNDDSRVVNNLEASLTDNARVIIYDCHMFIVQATGLQRDC